MRTTPTLAANNFLNWLALLACAFFLAACGGGGGDPGTVGGGTTTPVTPVTPVTPAPSTVLVALFNSAGVAANVLNSNSPLTAQATVKDGSGNPLANTVVTFSGDVGLISLSSSTGTSLTNASGVATITLRPFSNTVSGAGTITAAITQSTTTVQGSANFQVESTAVVTPGVPAAPTVTLALLNPAGQASNTATSALPLTVQATVKDAAGVAVNNALVAFASDNTLSAFAPSAGTSLTNAAGVATVVLRPLNLGVSGAGTVTASATVGSTTVQGRVNFNVGATSLQLSNISMTPASITAYGSSVVSVDVLANGVKYTDQQLNVKFSSACVAAGKATFAATVPTNGGTAQAVYRDQGCANNDVISASVDGASKSSSATLGITAPTAASIQFSSATPTDKSIVIKGQGALGRTETATLKFKVYDIFNNPLPRQGVRFTSSTTAVTINKDIDSTDANGEVIMTVNSGSTPTSFRIQAILLNADGTDTKISTQSDSIVVTTGVAVQRAFSLSVGSPNIEGLSYDSGPVTAATMVNILLADAAGNPVPDGTPVVFQTNMGAVGSSSKGACNTINGGCSVDFRSQEPRSAAGPDLPATPCNNAATGTRDATRTGLATICASSTDGLNTLFAKTAIFFSGSRASNVFWLDNPVVADRSKALAAVVDLGVVGATDSKVFTLQISDINLNPMPSGTKIEVTNITNATVGGVAPATVQNVFPHSVAFVDDRSGNNVAGNQGSTHQVTIASSLPKPCTAGITSTFNVAVTTPLGNTTSYPFKLAFTCP